MRAVHLCLALVLLCAACTSNGDTCDDVPADLGDLCIPGTVAPNLTTNVQVRELCGNPCSDLPTCTAVFRDAQLYLDTNLNYCLSSQSASCLVGGCLHRTLSCALPAMKEGEYALIIPGGALRTIKVQQGGASACQFPAEDGGS
jgi:hypothetical protein